MLERAAGMLAKALVTIAKDENKLPGAVEEVRVVEAL
jgi:hypothetical protein